MRARLLICAPLGLEAQALRAALGRNSVRRTGFGPRRSARSATALAAEDFGLLIVAGLGGGIGEGVRSGDVVVADEVRGPDSSVRCRAAPALAAELRRAGFPVHSGPILTTRHLVRGAQRAELARTGALAVDMESAVLARAAREIAVVRVVLDTAEKPLLRWGTPRRALAALARLHAVGTCLSRWSRAAAPRDHHTPEEVF
ncbi:4-hydroxy-3-methylbut-2-enyl diphosphate reductase [Saccharopolyspora antimicrobica]|uniref:4-hydroxy-3-methylbut-2-enyl diphosphate reductase n=1 Tax=Saccharopolyspora antimicrobica TaxID=455193 RepID=A0A1I4RLX5_9PSEU|nr:hypothetical protein [Saccharopolyspora antimicrobica]RKT87957.1 4-hydroxy-3-methylbut-2-enyl diphosphate reductase [Saccharopolyspora antimicrobica]SFM53237.1 4-hydroxy-3-methylbut-2-enyl diphosphate reductase [Saccharopolyspora antimicrobica]